MDRLGQQPEKQPKQELLILPLSERLKILGWKALDAIAKSDPHYAFYQELLSQEQKEDEKLERLYSPEDDEENIIRGEN